MIERGDLVLRDRDRVHDDGKMVFDPLLVGRLALVVGFCSGRDQCEHCSLSA